MWVGKLAIDIKKRDTRRKSILMGSVLAGVELLVYYFILRRKKMN